MPEHVTQWNHASDDWYSPKAENDLIPRGKFCYRMEAKDGSSGFDFWGNYDNRKRDKLIEYTMGDGRKVMVTFTENNFENLIPDTPSGDAELVDFQIMGYNFIAISAGPFFRINPPYHSTFVVEQLNNAVGTKINTVFHGKSFRQIWQN